MSEEELRAIIARYALRGHEERRANGEPVYLAWYFEVPNCLAEASNRDAALRELDGIIVPYLQTVMADGAELPVPAEARPRAKPVSFHRIWQIVLGDAKRLVGAQSLASANTGACVPVRAKPPEDALLKI